jgi:hypothetical protein
MVGYVIIAMNTIFATIFEIRAHRATGAGAAPEDDAHLYKNKVVQPNAAANSSSLTAAKPEVLARANKYVSISYHIISYMLLCPN